MAGKTLFFESVELSTKVWRKSETDPAGVANEATSIKNGKGAVGCYYSFVPSITDSAVYSTSFIEGDAGGAHGWRSELIYGSSFLIGNWTISFKLKNRAAYAHAGTVNARIYKTTVADPAVADLVKLNAVDGVSAVVTFTAVAGQIRTGTVTVWVNQNLMLDSEYLFVILNWKVTTAGGNANAGVKCVVNEGAAEQVVTADYFEGSPLEVQVGASADDARQTESSGAMFMDDPACGLQSSTLNTERQWGGLRFISAEFPIGGTTITVAYLRPYVWHASFDDVNINLHFEELASPVTFSALATIMGRDRTETSVSWIADGVAAGGVGWYNSPSLCGVGSPCEELWITNNLSPTKIVVIARPNTDALKLFSIRTWDYTGPPANVWGAILHLEWSAGGWANIKNMRMGTGSVLATDIAHIRMGTGIIDVADIAKIGGVSV